MPSDTDNLINEALAENYTLAPSGDALLDTLELRHPTFLDEDDNPTGVRVVMDYGTPLDELDDIQATGTLLTLEADAPLNASETVPFLGAMFDFVPPKQDDGGIPTMEISIDNAATLVSEKLDAAVEIRAPIEITYRQYLESDPDEPQYVLGGMTVQAVQSNLSRITMTAGFADLYNQSYPPNLYRPEDYVTLAA